MKLRRMNRHGFTFDQLSELYCVASCITMCINIAGGIVLLIASWIFLYLAEENR